MLFFQPVYIYIYPYTRVACFGDRYLLVTTSFSLNVRKCSTVYNLCVKDVYVLDALGERCIIFHTLLFP